MSTAADIRSTQKYNAAKTKQYAFRFFTDVNDQDAKAKDDLKVIAKLDSVENKTDYIRQLILADIERNG